MDAPLAATQHVNVVFACSNSSFLFFVLFHGRLHHLTGIVLNHGILDIFNTWKVNMGVQRDLFDPERAKFQSSSNSPSLSGVACPWLLRLPLLRHQRPPRLLPRQRLALLAAPQKLEGRKHSNATKVTFRSFMAALPSAWLLVHTA